MITWLFFALAFFSEIAGTMIGFGSSTIFLPIALFFVDFKTALVLVAFLHLFGNMGRLTFFRKGLDTRLLLLFGLPSLALTIVGALLTTRINPTLLIGILGGFLIIFSLVSLAKPSFNLPANTTSLTIGGALSGFFAGLIGTGGALRGAFLTATNLRKESYLATSAAVSLAVDAARIIIYLRSDFLTNYTPLPLLFIIAIAGSYTGKKLVDRVPQGTFRKIVLVGLLVIGAKFALGALGIMRKVY